HRPVRRPRLRRPPARPRQNSPSHHHRTSRSDLISVVLAAARDFDELSSSLSLRAEGSRVAGRSAIDINLTVTTTSSNRPAMATLGLLTQFCNLPYPFA